MAQIPRTNWSIKFVDSTQGAQLNPNYDVKPEYVYDGNPNTFWHTQWEVDGVINETPYPHEIQIDMGAIYSVDGFQYLPCVTWCGGDGWVVDYEFYVSINGIDWGTPVTGVFEKTNTLKQVTFTPKPGRYIRLRGLNADAKGQPYMSAAEIYATGVLLLNSRFKISDYVKSDTLSIPCTMITNVIYTDTYYYVFSNGQTVSISSFDVSGVICVPVKFSIGTYVKSDSLGIPCLQITDIKYTTEYYYVFSNGQTVSSLTFDATGVICTPCSDLVSEFKITII